MCIGAMFEDEGSSIDELLDHDHDNPYSGVL